SSDEHKNIKRIDDIIALRSTDENLYPTETVIGFANPGAGIPFEKTTEIFESSSTIDQKLKVFCDLISRVKPPQRYSLNKGSLRQGIAVVQKMNILSGEVHSPTICLSGLTNKNPH